MVVGPQIIEEYDLKIDNGQTKYNPEQDPSVSNEFATVSSFATDKCHSRIHTLTFTILNPSHKWPKIKMVRKTYIHT